MAINYKQCPKCESKNTLKIIFGLPTPEAFQKEEAGEIKLGGCCIMIGGPEYYCNVCQHEWNKDEAIDAAYNKIKGIKASIGGFFEGYINVDIHLSTLQFSWSRQFGDEEEKIQQSISATAAKKFIVELKSIQLLDWKAKYIEPGICDGTQWSVEIIREGRNIDKYGDNKFPDEWAAFCKLIRKITGRDFS